MNRGADHQPIFKNDLDRHDFLRLLGRTRDRFGLEIHAHCLMGNHFHAVVRTPEAVLSESMQFLSATFTRHFNMRHLRDGPLFRGRFVSVVIESDDQLLNGVRYVLRNPLDLGRDVDICNYRWSSMASYLDRRLSPKWLVRSDVLGLFRGDIDAFRRFIVYDFVDHLGHEANRDDRCDDAETAHRQPSPSARLDDVERMVGETCGVQAAQIHRSTRGSRNTARLAFVLLAIDTFDFSASEVANRFQVSESSVWSSLYRARALRAEDSEVGRKLEGIIELSKKVEQVSDTAYVAARAANVQIDSPWDC